MRHFSAYCSNVSFKFYECKEEAEWNPISRTSEQSEMLMFAFPVATHAAYKLRDGIFFLFFFSKSVKIFDTL